MKYLKSYKLFESHPVKSFFDEVDDILRPIQDEGFYIETHRNEDGTDDVMESDGEFVRIYIEKPGEEEENNPNTTREYLTTEYVPTETFIDSIQHLLSYSLDNGYGFSIELIHQSQTVVYEEYPESHSLSVEGVFELNAPIDYIRITIDNINED